MKEVEVVRISADLLRFNNPLVLKQTKTTRRCFYGELGRDSSGEWNARGTLYVERISPTGWVADVGPTLRRLKAGEMAKLEIHTNELKRFLVGLRLLEDAAKIEHLELNSDDLVIARRDEVIHIADRDQKRIIDELVREGRGLTFWKAMREADPDLMKRLADAEVQRTRRDALDEFERELVREAWTELDWEAFFLRNTWIFGIGLRFQPLSIVENQADYGGVGVDGKGAQRGEFLMRTGGDTRFTVLVEIKRPDSPIFSSSSKSYRNGVPGFASELANAISQLQVNAHSWELEGSQRQADHEKMHDLRIFTFMPRTLLIFGHTREIASDYDRRKSFELFRSNLARPEIMTYDEVLERARFIVHDSGDSEPPLTPPSAAAESS